MLAPKTARSTTSGPANPRTCSSITFGEGASLSPMAMTITATGKVNTKSAPVYRIIAIGMTSRATPDSRTRILNVLTIGKSMGVKGVGCGLGNASREQGEEKHRQDDGSDSYIFRILLGEEVDQR